MLDDIPSGARVFLDSNIFVYYFTARSLDCKRLLERCDTGDILGLTGGHVILEVLHKLMTIEAVEKGLVTPGNVRRKLMDHPEIVSRLDVHHQQVRLIPLIGVAIFPVDSNLILDSQTHRQRHGPLTMDSVSLALMEQHGVSNIATLDGDFARVGGIRVYTPRLA